MLRRIFVAAAFAALLATPAFAQGRIEVSGLFGYTFSEGVPVSATLNGVAYTNVDPASSTSYGFTFGVFLTPNTEVEFLWSRQATQLEVSGTAATLKGDMNIDTYHGNIVYNMGHSEAKVRPFAFIGLGATNYGDAVFATKTIQGLTRFSWALGGGVKAFPSEHVGVKAQVRWTPTYIKTDAAGWWCDPYFGCYPAGNTQFSNQFEMSGGVVLRF
jgi:hypothetical protein